MQTATIAELATALHRADGVAQLACRAYERTGELSAAQAYIRAVNALRRARDAYVTATLES